MCYIALVVDLTAIVEREKSALAAHRSSLRGAELPAPRETARGTFLHGLLLPFSLIASTLRDPELRGPYLRIAGVRILVVALLSAFALATGSPAKARHDHGPRIVIHHDKRKATATAPGAPAASGGGVHIDVPGVKVDVDVRPESKNKVVVLGQEIPVIDEDEAAQEPAAEPARAASPVSEEEPRGMVARVVDAVGHRLASLLAVLAIISGASGIVVALSRRYDDWISFGASRLAAIDPEDAAAPKPRIALDLRWLYKKLYRRVRGYVVFAAGVPALAILLVVPTIGALLFQIALTCWAWYWLGVFTAAKSAHAWADEGHAPSPMPIRTVNDGVPARWWSAPLRAYGRLWARLTRGVNPPASVFERAPAAFLGLALGRAILSMPILYLLARPLVPVAAGRLCAEADPHGRFTSAAPPAPHDLPTAA